MKPLVNLRQLRTDRNIKQQQLADLLNVSRPAYTNIENGKRETDFENLAKLAVFFGVSTDYILGLTDIPEPARLEPRNAVVPIMIHDEFNDLTQPELDKVAEYARFVKLQREPKPYKASAIDKNANIAAYGGDNFSTYQSPPEIIT